MASIMLQPVATYRLQLRPDFTLDDAADLVPYLARLGIDHLYTSPTLQAMPGSTNGYDVTDPARVNLDLGGQAAHQRLSLRLREYSLRRMVDIVPNHMAIAGGENPWWNDVLKNGRDSRHAIWFDVDWDASEALWPNRVLLPVLGDQFGRILEAGELQLTHAGGTFTLHYHDKSFPIALTSCAELLASAAASGHALLQFVADSLRMLQRAGGGPDGEYRQRHLAVLEDLLDRLCTDEPQIAAAIAAEVERCNGRHQQLGHLLEQQHYRLAYWRAADLDLGYRRFFNVNELAGLRVELPEVFERVHALPLQWLASGEAHALRVDHPDGLRDPAQYFRRLRAAAPDAWIVAEKILARDEALPADWPVEGTTGYEFANLVQGLFVDPAGEAPLTHWYEEFTGSAQPCEDQVVAAKRQALTELLGSEVARLTSLLREICERHWRHRDHTRTVLAQTLVAVIANFKVYRTYVRAGVPASAVDRQRILEAVAGARTQEPGLDEELLQFIEQLLLMGVEGDLEQELAPRFQQLTSPAMAKGVEDTLLYRYLRLVALNEVGGDPGIWGVTIEDFHAACEAMTRYPHALLTTSTHDTKRSEDVRARLLTLSEMPDAWISATRHWRRHNARHHDYGLDANTEYLYYQTLVGAWPIDLARLQRYLEKAVRECKVHTNWTQEDADYESRLRAFTSATLADETFLGEVQHLVTMVTLPGRINSLAQLLLKLTVPGVPDIYQGCELWDLSLCDPDNRRPVDFALRHTLLEALEGLSCQQVLQRMEEGLPKLWVLKEALAVRRELAGCFGAGAAYEPLGGTGEYRDHFVAFQRGAQVITVVPRLWSRIPRGADGEGQWGDWGETALELPAGTWRNRLDPDRTFTGKVPLTRLFRHVPLALLTRNA